MSEPLSVDAFRQAMSQFASGVTIVTTKNVTGLVGFTATGFSSVSLAPPLILVSINKEASAHDAVVASGHFGVSILAEEQAAIALRFARSGIERFEGVALRPGPTHGDVPLIDGALVHVECKKDALHTAGDHTILLGEVLSVRLHAGSPLLHFARKFGGFRS